MSEHVSAAAGRSAGSHAGYDAVVAGAGFAGMYLLDKLRRPGLTVRVPEAAPDVGATWYWNCYPGLRCNAGRVEYSCSFDDGLQQEWWSERFATQPEILRHARHAAGRFDLRRDMQFDTPVSAGRCNESTGRWDITAGQDEHGEAPCFVMATGCQGGLVMAMPPSRQATQPKRRGCDTSTRLPHRRCCLPPVPAMSAPLSGQAACVHAVPGLRL